MLNMNNEEQGIVYVLTNPAFQGLVKIGFTTTDDVKQRMSQLYQSGVPFPFSCVYAAKVQNYKKVEDAMHTAFGPKRVNPKREFFEIDVEQVIVILKLLELEDVTPTIKQSSNDKSEETPIEEIKAGEEYARKNRPKLNFEEMKIPIGSVLISTINEKESATVKSAKTVIFRDEETSLTDATKKILNIEYNIQPSPHWTFNGKKLKKIYEETFSVD